MRVLLALDGSQRSEEAAKALTGWAHQTAAEIHILSVLHPDEVHETTAPTGFTHSLTPAGTLSGQALSVREPRPTLAEDRSQALSRVAQEREDSLRIAASKWFEGLPVSVQVEGNRDTAAVIIAEARRIGADFIAMATRAKGGLGPALFGSTHEEVVRRSHVPVLLVGPAAGT